MVSLAGHVVNDRHSVIRAKYARSGGGGGGGGGRAGRRGRGGGGGGGGLPHASIEEVAGVTFML